jgi:hypothetical protein
MIPIIIVCYNNYKYVSNTLNQILRINEDYYKNVIIINNSSTCQETIDYLNTLNNISIINNINNGPWVDHKRNVHIYEMMPDKYILTDPDLEFNIDLPNNFIDILSQLSDKYECNKIGFALDISEKDKMYNKDNYPYEWELQFWNNKIEDDDYILYESEIDTTFSLINKLYSNNYHIRVAGNFTAKHLPWYKYNPIFTMPENYELNKIQTHISTVSRLVIPYIDNNYFKIYKNNELVLIENINPNLNYWINSYNDELIFEILDKFLSKDKLSINIGNGALSIYSSRKSKYIYSIQSDIYLFNDTYNNFKINCKENYLLINDKLSSISKLLEDYNIDSSEISLITVFENEELILEELYNLFQKFNIKLFISFNFNKWDNKNINRFEFLSDIQKNIITTSITPYILFD